MKCPRCTHELKTLSVCGVEVDACQDGCGGIWFDAFELEKMDQPDESVDGLLENMRVDLGIVVDVNKPIPCPRCEGVTLMRQKYPSDHRITVDKCRVCGGVWLDFGELFEIRASNPTSEERRAATAKALRDLRNLE